MRYQRVVYRKQEGVLEVSLDDLSFEHNGSVIETWTLASLDKVAANAKGANGGKSILRINHVDLSKKSLFFRFENRQVLEEAREELKAAVAEAKRAQRDAAEWDNDDDDASSVPFTDDDLKASEITVTVRRRQSIGSSNRNHKPPPPVVAAPPPLPPLEESLSNLEIGKGATHQATRAIAGPDFLNDKTESTVACSVGDNETMNNTPQNMDDWVALMKKVCAEYDKEKSETTTAKHGEEDDVEIAVEPFMDEPEHDPMQESAYGDLDPAMANQAELTKLIDIKNSKQDDDWHAPFPESTYTLIYMCSVTSQGFWYATFVYVLQVATISLTMVDIIDMDASENPLRIPPMVSNTVTCAQAVALFMVLAYQSDLIEAVIKLQDGFYPEVLEKHPGATYCTWLFSCLAQLGAGLLLLSASFILTMQISSVIEGMLNLTALTFMAEIDDIGFAMAKMGFIRTQLQIEAESVVDFMVPKRRSRNWSRRFCYFFALICLFVGFGILKSMQLNGHYLQSYVYVQFGDAYNRKIPYYSGILSSQQKKTSGYRKYRDLGTDNILLAYCSADRAWTFSDKDTPCDYFAKSPETRTYDVTSIPDAGWLIKDNINRLQPFDKFSLVGRDCDDKICQGKCVKGLCECPQEKFGMDCEYTDVCPELSVDLRFPKFPEATNIVEETFVETFDDDFWGSLDDDWHKNLTLNPYSWKSMDTNKFAISDEFEILRNETEHFVKVYNMPVYYSNKTYPANVIFFAGRRWIITSELGLIDLPKARKENPTRTSFPEKTAAVLGNDFHAYHEANFSTFFLSDPVDFETPDFLPTPSGLNWWTVGIVNGSARFYAPDSELETILNCKACFAAQGEFCGAGGTCNQTTGVCDCVYGYIGAKCEIQQPCYDYGCENDGVCDESTGKCRCRPPAFGDLCEKTHACFLEDSGGCLNGGECNMTTGSCECPENDWTISGKACEIQQDCNIHGCKNGGLCSPLGKCVCHPPFHGGNCELVNTTQKEFFCYLDEDCANGSCDAETGMCVCNDPSAFGTLCEHQYNCSLTDWYVCPYSATCNHTSGHCNCPKGRSGVFCDTVALCMDDSECEGEYSWCYEGQCGCEYPRGGLFCEQESAYSSCKERGCNGRGECKKETCECASPFVGNQCDSILWDENNIWMNTQVAYFIDRCGFPPYAGSSVDVSNMTRSFSTMVPSSNMTFETMVPYPNASYGFDDDQWMLDSCANEWEYVEAQNPTFY